MAKDKADEDTLMEIAIENGGEDVKDEGDTWGIYTDVQSFADVREAVEKAGIEMIEANISMIPSTTTKVEGKKLVSLMKMMDLFDDLDDVQNISINAEFDENELD